MYIKRKLVLGYAKKFELLVDREFLFSIKDSNIKLARWWFEDDIIVTLHSNGDGEYYFSSNDTPIRDNVNSCMYNLRDLDYKLLMEQAPPIIMKILKEV